jgi:DNA-binding XRE family transcriptional regulator
MTMLKIMTLDEIINKLHDKNLKKVAQCANVSYRTLRSIYKGEQKNPSIDTMIKLTDYFN